MVGAPSPPPPRDRLKSKGFLEASDDCAISLGARKDLELLSTVKGEVVVNKLKKNVNKLPIVSPILIISATAEKHC
jgi:hypothetical protein